jgi:serine/threonine protein kinase
MQRIVGAKEVPPGYLPPYETPSVKNNPIAKELVDRTLEKWFGLRQVPANSVMGEGGFGRVLLLKITREMRDNFSRVPFTFWSKYTDVVTPRTGVWRVPKDQVAVKVTVGESQLVSRSGRRPPGASKTDGIQRSIAGIRREIDVLKALSTSEPVTIARKVYDVKRVIPKLHATGYDAQMHAGVIVMQAFPMGRGYDRWMTLYTLMTDLDKQAQDKKVPYESVYKDHRWIRDRLEYALTSLFVAGYVHMDLHANNIAVNVATKKLKILDFGSSVKMPTDLRNEFRGMVARTGPVRKTLTTFWDSKLQRFADSVIRGRIATYFGTVPNKYHHNVNIIDKLARRYDNATYSVHAQFTTPSLSAAQNRLTPTTVVTVQTNRNNGSVKGKRTNRSASNNSKSEEGEIREKKRKRSKSNSNGNSGPLITRQR